MANEPYDPYIPSGSRPDPSQGPSNTKTAAIQQQIDDTVSRHTPMHPCAPLDARMSISAWAESAFFVGCEQALILGRDYER